MIFWCACIGISQPRAKSKSYYISDCGRGRASGQILASNLTAMAYFSPHLFASGLVLELVNPESQPDSPVYRHLEGKEMIRDGLRVEVVRREI